MSWLDDVDEPDSNDTLVRTESCDLCIVGGGYTVLASRRHAHEAAEALSTALDRRVGVITLVAYVVVIALTMVLYLNHHHVDPLV